jgi:hypothetical protein
MSLSVPTVRTTSSGKRQSFQPALPHLRKDEVLRSASLALGKFMHILRPYRTWKGPLAIPNAGDDTATSARMGI